MITEITSVHNPRIQSLRALQKAKGRREQGCFLTEGIRMVREAVAMGRCRTLVVDRARSEDYAAHIEQALAQSCEVLLVTAQVLSQICDSVTPQGIAAAVTLEMNAEVPGGDRLVALDGVQDPGNVGTIIRTADAAGFDGILMSSACADLYSPKTLRSTMGSVFRMPVYRTDSLPAVLSDLRDEGYAVVSTELGGEDFYARCPKHRAILVIGSEGNGVTPEVRNISTHHLALPMRGGAESLNAAVAAGIMIYEMAHV